MNGKTLTRPSAFIYTPATDTTELPSLWRGCPPTRELHLLELPPVVQPTVRLAGLRRAVRRIAGSGFVRRDLRASVTAAASTAGVVVGLVAAVLVVRGALVLLVELSAAIR